MQHTARISAQTMYVQRERPAAPVLWCACSVASSVRGTDQRHASFCRFHLAMEVVSPNANFDICFQRQNYESLTIVLKVSAKRT